MNETEQKIEEIKETIREKPDLVIQRVPEKTLKWFKDKSFNDFSGDYGMLLKHLVDFYEGIIPTGWEHLEVEIEELKVQVAGVMQQLQEGTDDIPRKRMLNGKGE